MRIKRIVATLLLWSGMAAVAAAEPALKALIVDGQNNHNWKATTPLLKKALEETGLFTVDVVTAPGKGSSDYAQAMARFRPNFAGYSVVVMNYNGDDWPAETRKDLESYVAGGGGLVSVHAADNSFPNWKAYNEMIGLGGWGGRNEKSGPYVYWKDGRIVRDTSKGPGGSHGAQHPFLLEVRQPEHPITKGLPLKFRHAPDELYSLLRGPAKNLTVLATAYADPKYGGTGRNEPILMTIDFGKGRVFHTTMGHDAPQCRSVAFIVTLQRGAEWAATGKVTQAVPADFPGADQPRVRE
jgi:type 1 glutamine amidotransferase